MLTHEGKLYATRSEYAAHLGASKAYATKLGHQGRLVEREINGKKLVDVELTDRLIRNTTDAPVEIRFTNPETGVIYAARRYGPDADLAGLTSANPMNQRQVDRGIASRMIAHANELLAAAFRVQSTNPDGTHVMARDTAGALIPVDANLQVRARAITAYRNYVGLIDAVRNISNRLGYGLQPGGDYDDETRITVEAFQRHWRPTRVDGVADGETRATLMGVLQLATAESVTGVLS